MKNITPPFFLYKRGILMEIPKILKIGGHDYNIILNPICRTDNAIMCCGMHKGAQELIEINPNYPPGTQASTLLHEIIEAINWTYEVGLEHRQISMLEETLYQVFKDNNLHFDE